MTKARRLLALTAVLTVAVIVMVSRSWGDPAPREDRVKLQPGEAFEQAAPPRADTEAALAITRLSQGTPVSYVTTEGETLFALQLKPTLPPAKTRPRDYLILIGTSASQAGAPWFAARQIAEAVVKQAAEDDRIALWTINETSTNLSQGFLSPKTETKTFETLFTKFKKDFFPAGDTDLGTGLDKAVNTFEIKDGRQRILLYLGDGLSTHNPITSAQRVQLCKLMVDRQINLFSVPLGIQFNPENLHGLATGTGGAVVRVKVMEETIPEVTKQLQEAFAAPVLYPTRFELDGATEYLPSRLPPLRPDVPTLVVGKTKGKALSYVVQGAVDGRAEMVTVKKEEKLPEPELDNFFLVSILNQWKNASELPALIRADRALVFAYEQNRLQKQELLLGAQLALQDNAVDAAGHLYEQALKLAPRDPEALAGTKLVGMLRDGKLTRDALKKQIDQLNPEVVRLGKDGKAVHLRRDDLIQLAQLDNKLPPKAGGPEIAPLERPDLLQEFRNRVALEEQKTLEAVDFSIRQARKLLPTQPDEARDLLRNTLLRVADQADIGEKLRSDLLGRLQTELRGVQIRGAAIKLRQMDEARLREQVAAQIRGQQEHEAEENALEGQYRIYKQLMNRARFEEVTERQVLEGLTAMRQEAVIKGTPVPQTVTAAYFQTATGYNLQQMIELRRRRNQGFLATMMSVERSAVPTSDEPPINFPPLAMWKAITNLRKDKYISFDLPDDPKARDEARAIYRLLEQPWKVETFKVPQLKIKEFINLITLELAKDHIELPILINYQAFKDAKDELTEEEFYGTEVKIPQEMNRLALGTILRIALSKLPPAGGTFMIRRNFIEVTTAEKLLEEKVTRIYPVGELVLPISPAGPNSTITGGFAGIQGGNIQGFSGIAGQVGIGGGIGGFAGLGGGLGGFGGGLAGFGGGLAGIGGGLAGFGGGFGGVPIGGGFGGGFQIGGGFGGGFGVPIGGGFGGGFQIGGAIAGAGLGGFGGAAGIAGGGVILGGAMGQNCLGFNLGGFNGNLGFQGSTQNQLLVALIQQTIAPGEWGAQNCQNPLLAQAFGMAGGPPPPDAAVPLKQSNTLGFYPPALALVVRGTSRIHLNLFGGLLGGVPQKDAGAMADFDRGVRVAGNDAKRKGVAGSNDENPEETARKMAVVKAIKSGDKCPICGKYHDEWDPRKVWQAALEYGVGDPGLILATADFLVDHGKFNHAAEFLKANLRMGICVRPWVYEALAVALEASGGSPDDVKRARLSAVALNPKDAQGFLSGARALSKAKQWDRALAFCRQAAQLEPKLPTPYEDALEYAALAKDSRAMEWAVGNLLSNDWPVDNEILHLKAQSRLNQLAQALAESGRKAEADRLQATLQGLRERDLIFKLTWQDGTGPADVEFTVEEPGKTVCSSQQRQTPGGGILLGNTLSEPNRATYVAAEGFTGTYQLTIRSLWGRPLGGRAMLEIIQHQGTNRETRRLESVTVNNKQIVKVDLTSGRRTALAVVPPPGLRPRSPAADKRNAANVFARLRDLASPDFSEYQKTTGSIGMSSAASWDAQEEITVRPQTEHLAYQATVAPISGSGVDLTARAVVSADQRYVRLSMTPVFQTAGRSSGPVVSLPIIPGGSE